MLGNLAREPCFALLHCARKLCLLHPIVSRILLTSRRRQGRAIIHLEEYSTVGTVPVSQPEKGDGKRGRGHVEARGQR